MQVDKKTKLDNVLSDSNQLALIPHKIHSVTIEQRATDGYVNASALCQACNKLWGDYTRLKSTDEFLQELSSDMGIPISDAEGSLIQSIKGGIPRLQGTWVHPDVATNLAVWASPKFAVAVSRWVREWLTGNVAGRHHLPYHIQRYLINRSEIPPTHFSVFNEIMVLLIAPLEDIGYRLPDKMIPDISQGRMFAQWVRADKKLEPNDFPTYTHTYPDGRKIPNVKLYPNSLLADFREHFNNVWIKKRARKYFTERDEIAIPYLEQSILALPQTKD